MTGHELVRYRSGVWDSVRWQSFSARPGDIVVSCPPKSGTTWMQMICGLLIFQRTTFDRSLDLISPWLEMQTREIDDVIAEGEMRRLAQRLGIDVDDDAGRRRDADRVRQLASADLIDWAHREPL